MGQTILERCGLKCSSGINEFEECASKLMTRMYDQKAKIVKTKKALINLYNLFTFKKFYASSSPFCNALLFPELHIPPE